MIFNCVSVAFLMRIHRSSGSQMFYKVGVYKTFAKFTGNHLCWSLHIYKFKKRGPSSGVFL